MVSGGHSAGPTRGTAPDSEHSEHSKVSVRTQTGCSDGSYDGRPESDRSAHLRSHSMETHFYSRRYNAAFAHRHHTGSLTTGILGPASMTPCMLPDWVRLCSEEFRFMLSNRSDECYILILIRNTQHPGDPLKCFLLVTKPAASETNLSKPPWGPGFLRDGKRSGTRA